MLQRQRQVRGVDGRANRRVLVPHNSPRSVREKRDTPISEKAANSANLARTSAMGIDISFLLLLPVEIESKMLNEAYCGIGNTEEKLKEKRGG